MAKLRLMPFAPSLIPEKRFAVNGRMPSPNALGRAAGIMNTVAGNQCKVVGELALDTQSTPAGSSFFVTHHYFMFRTGENVEKVTAIIGMAPADNTSAGNQAYTDFSINGNSTTLNASPAYYPDVDAGTYTPSQVHWARVSITADDGLQPNTLYCGQFNQYRYNRIHSFCVFEEASQIADTTVTGICDAQAFEQGKPIYDASVQDVLQAGTKLWQHNGAHLACFSRRSSTASVTIAGKTWKNILKTGSSTFSSTDPGYHFRTTYHDSLSADIPMEMGIRGARTAGTGTLDIKLVRSSGDIVTISGFTNAGASSIYGESNTFTMPAMDEHVQIFAKCSDAGTTFDIYGLGVWEYEA